MKTKLHLPRRAPRRKLYMLLIPGPWRPVNLVPPTPQSFARGFKVYAVGIRRELVKLGHNPYHPGLRELYDLYRGEIKR